MTLEKYERPGTVSFVMTALLLAISVFMESGCSTKSDLGRVVGRVTIDGKPVQGGIILFQPEGRRPSYARLDADGKYALQYTAGNPGAVIGQQKVQLKMPTEDQLVKLPAGIGAPTRIPTKFLEPFQTVDVRAGRNEFHFDLKTN